MWRGYTEMMLSVYTGPMFSEKTTGLILETQLALEQGKTIEVFKPAIDGRYNKDDITTHAGLRLSEECFIKPIVVPTNHDFSDSTAEFVAIDEAQFFDHKIVHGIEMLLRMGTHVVVAGLDMDSNGNPFGYMPQLMAKANIVYKRETKCAHCSGLATRTYRKPTVENQESVVLVGGSEMYEPRCMKCWLRGG